MLASLSTSNAARFFYFAHVHRLDELKEILAYFINANKPAVQKSDGWKQYIAETANLIEELYVH